MDSLWTPKNIASHDGSAMKQSTHQFHIFSYLKMFRMQCRRKSALEDNKKKITTIVV